MNVFMKRALELATQNAHEGGQPYGAVLVHGDRIIGEGVNELHRVHDVSGHAELLAVRRAQNALEADTLDGAVMYASGEPCPMCLTAMYFAGISRVFYCQSASDAAAAGLGRSATIYQELCKPAAARSLPLVHMPLVAGQEDPLESWKQQKSS